MRLVAIFILVGYITCFSQNRTASPNNFKGEHYALYNKCLSAITFCELTQQTYTSCGSVKNCYGLYVMPGDTFYVNIEDKTQSEIISANISFNGYFSAINGFIFKPIDNNCIPQQALQIIIPLSAVPNSSFQIIAQNTAYVNHPADSASIPPPFNIYVGGQQPQFTFALSDFTVCPVIEQVSVIELTSKHALFSIYPNPTTSTLNIIDENNQLQSVTIEIKNYLGQTVYISLFSSQINLSGLPAGIYFLTIQSKSIKKTIKFIKE